MLAVAGNETTRNSITHGMIAFAQNPDQWELYKKERPESAADEIVRWATPVSAFQRTALEDTELGGVKIKKGERVVMSYRSANFDDEVFEDPHTFNIMRTPNQHVGFGGTGARLMVNSPLHQRHLENLARMAEAYIRGEPISDEAVLSEISQCFVDQNGLRTDIVVLGMVSLGLTGVVISQIIYRIEAKLLAGIRR